MNNLNRKITLLTILAISHLVVYFFGAHVNRQTMLSSFTEQFSQTNATLNLGRYTEYRDIASDIKTGKYDKAKCSAELGASAMYDDLKSCLAKQNCKVAIEQEAHKVAPELLGEAPLKFTYLESKNGLRSCESGQRYPVLH